MSEPLRRTVLALLAALAAAPAARPADPPAPVAVVRVGHLYTGKEWLEPGFVVIAKGKVLSVGKEAPASPPEGGRVDLPTAWAMPGLVEAAATAGIEGGDSEQTREVTPCVRPLRTFDPRSREARTALRAGVTTLFLEPGNACVVGGIASLVKTAPGPAGAPRVLRATAALKIAFGADPSAGNFAARGIPPSIYARRPTTRMGVLAVLRDAWILGRAAGVESPDADLAAMARAAAGEIPVRALARTEEDLLTALRVREDLGFLPVLEGVTEGYRVADRLAKAGASCVVGPVAYPVGGRGPEGTDPAMENPGALLRAGVRVALTSGGDGAGLRDQAALAARWGFPRDAALRGVTSEAAALCGAGDRVGTLAKGMDADLVVLDGDPLEPSSRVRLVVVDGEAVFETEGAR
jgi:imidazolonepropionase-like amidohydrolase